MSAVFDMGRYAAFIWPAYGVSVVGLAVAIALTWRAYTRAKERLARLENS